MDKNNVIEIAGRAGLSDPLTELLREGARQLLQKAVEAELASFLATFEGRLLDDGRAAVVLVPPFTDL